MYISAGLQDFAPGEIVMNKRHSSPNMEEKIAAEFRVIEKAAPAGILDLVQVCGDYAQAVRQADVYFGLLSPSMLSFEAASTGQ